MKSIGNSQKEKQKTSRKPSHLYTNIDNSKTTSIFQLNHNNTVIVIKRSAEFILLKGNYVYFLDFQPSPFKLLATLK